MPLLVLINAMIDQLLEAEIEGRTIKLDWDELGYTEQK